jgi:two-component system, NtrC family, nitrogen regulation response regulator NtrX
MRILIADDERAIRRALREIFEFEGYSVDEVENGEEALAAIRKKEYDAIFCDIKMPHVDGMEVQAQIKLEGINVPMIMISGHGTVETAVQAIKNGAFDFIEKPLDLNRLLITLRNVKERGQLLSETVHLKTTIRKFKGTSIIGESASIKAILAMIEKVAPSDARVLITGQNGSGKELVARALHDNSNRSKASFSELCCNSFGTH